MLSDSLMTATDYLSKPERLITQPLYFIIDSYRHY